MIHRIVKLVIKPGLESSFERIFLDSKPKIEASPGCHQVSLLQHSEQPNIFFTFSLWESEEALNHYRSTPFFAKTWKSVKALFLEKASAWSTTKIS